jgi:hypothetical protein
MFSASGTVNSAHDYAVVIRCALPHVPLCVSRPSLLSHRLGAVCGRLRMLELLALLIIGTFKTAKGPVRY